MNYNKMTNPALMKRCNDLNIKNYKGKNKKDLIELICEFNKNPVNKMNSYIYIRYHESLDKYDVCKLGMSANTTDREKPYVTGEFIRGMFKLVVKVNSLEVRNIEKDLQRYFTEQGLHRNGGGGTEFFNKDIERLLVPWLQNNGFEHRVLSEEEIDELDGTKREQNTPISVTNNDDCVVFDETQDATHDQLNPNTQQQYVLGIINPFYELNSIGKIIWACGLGKAMLSILIVKLMMFKTVVFGVPNTNLQTQIKNEILKIFPNKNNLLFIGGDEESRVNTKEAEEQIRRFINIKDNGDPKFIIPTYHSCHLLVNCGVTFDFKIGDEAHHLAGIEKEEDRGFRKFHKIESKKTLFMTATEKIIESTDSNQKMYSMDNEHYFGKLIDKKSVYWAIENKKITDYNLLVLKNTIDEVDEIISKIGIKNVDNKEIFISAYMCLQSFILYGMLTHILLYTNTTKEADLAMYYISEILSSKILNLNPEDVYNQSLHTKNDCKFESEVYKFKTSKYGIIPCVHKFGEGFDLPELNGTCVAVNMQSSIKIIQYLLRSNRLQTGNPNKKAHIIIPYIDTDTYGEVNKSFEKLRNIVSQIRIIDENVEHKITVVVKISDVNNEKKITELNNVMYYEEGVFEENIGELNKLKIRLRYSKAIGSNFTEEQDEYDYVRSINMKMSVRSLKEYNENERNHCEFVKDPENYFKLKGVWIDLYHFIGVDTSKFIKSKQEWINFCNEKNIRSLESYEELCEKNDCLPKEPSEFYRDFTNVQTELVFIKRR